MLADDLMMEQLQRQRNMANARVKLEQEKRRILELTSPRKRSEAEIAKATGRGSATATERGKVGEAGAESPEMPYMKPVTDKQGKTIERPMRPL